MKNIIAIWKPKGPTSHDMVYKVRKITGEKKVGHAGTLDPLAEGILVMGITRDGTKQLSELVKKEKEYLATVKLGEVSTTDDDEGEKSTTSDRRPSREEVEEILPKFTGKIMQVPPVFSAIKVSGKRAYDEARKGKEIELEPREILIKEIELIKYEYPLVELRIVTGPGAYIRSIARDLGQELQAGGYLANLIRTRVGDFSKNEAFTLEELEKHYG